MNSAAYASYRAAAELGDPDDGPAPCRPRCTRCGGWLKDKPDASGFDRLRDEYYVTFTCPKCGRPNQELVFG